MERPLVADLGNFFFLTRFVRREFEGLRVPRGEDGVHGGGVHQVGVVVPDEVGHVAEIIQKQYKKMVMERPLVANLGNLAVECTPLQRVSERQNS